MAPRNRPKHSKSAAGDKKPASRAPAARPRSVGLEGFALLPHELRIVIFRLACGLPPRSSSAPSSTGSIATGLSPHSALPGLDVATTVSLARVCRSLYAQLTPLIWSHIWINRPSDLVSLQKAIAARPQLGRLIHSLHVGPDTELPDFFFPLDQTKHGRPIAYGDVAGSQEFVTWITTTLRGGNEAPLLPRGCSPTKRWTLDEPDFDCQSLAVYQALIAAQRTVDVSFDSPGVAYSSKKNIGTVAWTQRLFDAHAAFELFLFKMREVEQVDEEYRKKKPDYIRPRSPDSRPGDHSMCSKYPRLVIEGFPPLPQNAKKELPSTKPAFVVTRADILRHLARRGSITDRFDHPLLFVRSGIDTVNRARRNGQHRYPVAERRDLDLEDFADLFSPSHGFGRAGSTSLRSAEVLDPLVANTATLGALLGHLRSVLSYTPYLANLSLTGFLERAVCGTRSVAPLLKELRSLSLGPPPLAWLRPMEFSDFYLLEKLRICGVLLRGDEAHSIYQELMSLEEMQWRLPSTVRDQNVLFHSVNLLIGREDEEAADLIQEVDPFTEAKEFNLIAVESDSDEDDYVEALRTKRGDKDLSSPATVPEKSYLPLFEVRLHPTDRHFLLEKAPSPAVRQAWSTGREWGGKEDFGRLLLVENAKPTGCYGTLAADMKAAAMYREGREWWERHGGVLDEGKEEQDAEGPGETEEELCCGGTEDSEEGSEG